MNRLAMTCLLGLMAVFFITGRAEAWQIKDAAAIALEVKQLQQKVAEIEKQIATADKDKLFELLAELSLLKSKILLNAALASASALVVSGEGTSVNLDESKWPQ